MELVTNYTIFYIWLGAGITTSLALCRLCYLSTKKREEKKTTILPLVNNEYQTLSVN